MMMWKFGLCLLMSAMVGVPLVGADLPVECHFGDIQGHWTFQETARDGGPDLPCTELGDVVFEKKIRLDFPNKAVDEDGNVGTWTMVYDQGFEVRVGGRSYFAFSYFENDDKQIKSYCSRTFTGWSRDLTVRNWSCFNGTKLTAPVSAPFNAPLTATANSSEPTRVRSSNSALLTLQKEVPYKQDVRFVDSINRHQSNWTAKIYPQFEGLSLHDVFKMRGGQVVRKSQRKVPNQKSAMDTRLRASMLPESFDWRNVSGINYVRPVKNQGPCGSCYAFASIGMMESQLLLRSAGKEQMDLSAEDIVGCSKLSQGCDGGFPYLIAGRYGQDAGLVSSKCVPYKISPDCNHDRDSCRKIYTTEYKYVGGYFGACNEEEMMLALYENGPLAVGIEVSADFMQYKGGVYHHTGLADAFNPLEMTNHAVVLAGWGATKQGEKYWVVQNSWGKAWGLDGYVLISRGTDEIAIESMAVQAVAYP